MPLSPVDISTGWEPGGNVASDGTDTLINWRMLDSSGQDKARTNTPRPAIIDHVVTGLSDVVIGSYYFRGQLIVVCDDRFIYRIPASAPTTAISLSTAVPATKLDGAARPVFAEDDSGVFIAGGGYLTKWTPGDATCARVTGGPPAATHIAALGQRMIANDRSTPTTRNQIFWSELGSGFDTSWSPLSFATAEARPDEIVAIYENTSELFVFGETTLQVFQISPDPNNPFAPANTVNVGCSAPYSPVRIDDNFAFIDESRRIVISDGRTTVPYGSSVDSLLREFSTVSDAWSFREREGVRDIVVFQFPGAERTLETDTETKAWSERRKYNTASGMQEVMPIASYTYWPQFNYHLYGSSASATVYRLSPTDGQDFDSSPILCERVTGWHDHGTQKRKRSTCVRVIMRRGTSGPTATPGVLEVAVQDDGEAWSEYEQCSIGNDGDGDPTVRMYPGGVFGRRRYSIRCAAPEEYALVAVYDEVAELAT